MIELQGNSGRKPLSLQIIYEREREREFVKTCCEVGTLVDLYLGGLSLHGQR